MSFRLWIDDATKTEMIRGALSTRLYKDEAPKLKIASKRPIVTAEKDPITMTRLQALGVAFDGLKSVIEAQSLEFEALAQWYDPYSLKIKDRASGQETLLGEVSMQGSMRWQTASWDLLKGAGGEDILTAGRSRRLRRD